MVPLNVISNEDRRAYYEKEAYKDVLFGSLREISLTENIMQILPSFTTLVDVGCGDGYLLYSLAQKHKHAKLYGLDLTQKRIMTTKKHVPSAYLLCSDIQLLPFSDNSFDIVICSEVLEHLPDYKKTLNELFRITKNRLIITVPNEQPLTKVFCPKCKTIHYLDGHLHSFSEADFRSFFSINEIHCIRKFHSIYTYNKMTLRLPLFLRLFLDHCILYFHSFISFLKPNFLLIAIDKKEHEST